MQLANAVEYLHAWCLLNGYPGAKTKADYSLKVCYFVPIGRGHLNITDTQDEAPKPISRVTSVAGTILGEFFDVLENEEGFKEIAQRLRKVVLENGVFAEPSIRTAIFPEAP